MTGDGAQGNEVVPELSIRLNAVLAGRTRALGDAGHTSAIDKRPLSGRVQVGRNGLVDDEQAERDVHGGPEKALHHYAFDHYAWWRETLTAPPAILHQPGAFGENLSTTGLTEAEVCVGDVYSIGEVIVQVSQGRQPCWKLNLRFGERRMARLVQSTGRTGWYYRVLQPGAIEAGESLRLIERPHPDWSLARVLHVLYVDTLNFDALNEMASLVHLNERWRNMAARRVARRRIEDWSARLGTEA